MKKIIIICLIAIFTFSYIFVFFEASALTSSKNEVQERVEVPNGMKVIELANLLENKNLIRNKNIFYIFARYPIIGKMFFCPSLFLKSGTYNIKSSMSCAKIFKTVSSGLQDYIHLSFPEGLTISKIASRLEEKGVCKKDDFIRICKSASLLEKYNIASTSLEGYLFPDTYFFTLNMEPETVASVMVENFFNHINEIPKIKNLTSEDFLQTLILASIVEREYRLEEEAPLIASVFKNRIQKGIGLYSCATIEYIITEIQGKEHPDVITYDDLKIDSPYNTYKWASLPPTPISNPGMVSIKAVVEERQTPYYYFRLVDKDKGKHVFSANFSTHIKEGESFSTKK